MIQYDRKQMILKMLEEQQTATVRELAAKVFSSEASVRRDLAALEKLGYVKRVYGGVLLSQNCHFVTPVGLRDSDNAGAKNLIAQRAAELIPNGSTIIMDASSTTRRILKYIDHVRDLRIFTNNLRVFEEIQNADAQVYCTGGIYNRKNHAFVGPAAETFLKGISADILFFSSQGISEDGDISDVSEEETSLRRVMLTRAKRKIFLCDSSKFNIRRDFVLCNKDDVDDIICNTKLPWDQ